MLERAGLTEGSWHGNGEGPGKQGTKGLENFASLQEEERKGVHGCIALGLMSLGSLCNEHYH